MQRDIINVNLELFSVGFEGKYTTGPGMKFPEVLQSSNSKWDNFPLKIVDDLILNIS